MLSFLGQVFAPKFGASVQLQQLVMKQPVSHQVLFSSVASLLGSPGQANYAAANAALDGLATHLSSAGLPTVSIQWGAWSGGGMAAADSQTAARVERMGMSLITPAAGLAALEGVLGQLNRCNNLGGKNLSQETKHGRESVTVLMSTGKGSCALHCIPLHCILQG